MPEQLILPLQPPRLLVAETFINIPAMVTRLNAQAGIPGNYLLRGLNGTGKTHLLHAVANSLGASYCPLPVMLAAGTAALEGYEQVEVLCLDDLHVISESAVWAEALHKLLTQRQELGRVTLMATADLHQAIDEQTFELVESVTLWPLSKSEKCQAVTVRATFLGLKLAPSGAEWLVNQFGSDMAQLMHTVRTVSRALPAGVSSITGKRLGMMRREGAFTQSEVST